jgi:hypothetical protein
MTATAYTELTLAEILGVSYKSDSHSWMVSPARARELERQLVMVGARRRSSVHWDITHGPGHLRLTWAVPPSKAYMPVRLTGAMV